MLKDTAVAIAQKRLDKALAFKTAIESSIPKLQADLEEAKSGKLSEGCEYRLRRWQNRERKHTAKSEYAPTPQENAFLQSLAPVCDVEWWGCNAKEWLLACRLVGLGLVEVDENISKPLAAGQQFSARLVKKE